MPTTPWDLNSATSPAPLSKLSQSTMMPADPAPVKPTLTAGNESTVMGELADELYGSRAGKEGKESEADNKSSIEFDLFEVEDLITKKNERIEALELEVKHLKARVALLDGRLKKIGKR